MRIFLVTLLLTGCANYVKPLCDATNRRDVPNLEGRFSTLITLVGPDGTHTEHGHYVITRLDRGSYLLETDKGSERAGVCEVSGRLYIENAASWGSGLPNDGFSALLLAVNEDNSFALTSLGVDSHVLDARHIPYKLVEHSTSKEKGNSPYNNILVDNSGLTAEQFAQLLDPMTVRFALWPEAGAHVQGKSSKFSW